MVQAFNFAIDIICVMPPLDAIEAVGISRELCITATISALFLLIVAFITGSLKKAIGMPGKEATIVGICITIIGFWGLNSNLLREIVPALYPPLVIALRFGEGTVLGVKYRSGSHWWKLLIMLPIIAFLYVAMNTATTDALQFAKGVWSVLSAVLASYGLTTIVCDNSHGLFNEKFTKVAIFLVFASTVLYVQTSPMEQLLFQWVFPVGMFAGFVVSHKGERGN